MTVTLVGTSSKDVLSAASAEAHHIIGLAGNDTLTGGAGNDTLDGGAGNDAVDGGSGDDVIVVAGGQGFDRVIGGTGTDTILGGLGDDVIGLSGSSALASIETIDGGGGSDTILGSSNKDVIDLRATTLVGIASIDGGDGKDTLFGSAGDDVMVGGAGDDVLDGAGGDDVFLANGAGQGLDRFSGGAGADTILGGVGDDVIGLSGATPLVSIEAIDGGGGSNTILGSAKKDVIDLRPIVVTAMASVDGAAGNDTIYGSAVGDTLVGGAGNDRLDGAGGKDVAVYAGAFGSYTITDNGVSFVVDGSLLGEGVDTLFSIETIRFANGDFVDGVFVDPDNIAPLAIDDEGATDEDTPVVLDVLGNDEDGNDDPLTIQGVGAAVHGTVVIKPDGKLRYTPHPNFNGDDGFTYTVSDDRGGTDTGVVGVSVAPVNDAPNGVADDRATDPDTPVVIDVLANDDDIDGDAPIVTGATQPANGLTAVNPDGTITYTPNAGFTGVDVFTYEIGDPGGLTDAATVSVAVGVEPPAGVFLDALAAMPEGSWSRLNLNDWHEVFVPEAQRNETPSHMNPERVIRAWSSMAWDPNGEQLIFWGGGHRNYSGNEVYLWDAQTLSWERGSLPSQIIQNDINTQAIAIDGVDNAPVSSHTYDNSEFLPLANRFVTFGGASFSQTFTSGQPFLEADGVTRTGPYFWDPTKADADQVGGTTGSQVDPVQFPDVVGGQMWENRDHWGTLTLGESAPKNVVNGTTDYAFENGKEVIYVGTVDNLYRYVINDPLDAGQDRWQLVGGEGPSIGNQGAGAYDPSAHVYVRTANGTFTYWDTTLSGASNNNVNFVPFDPTGEFQLLIDYGMDFDQVRGDFVLWDGDADVWRLTAPDVLGPDGWVIVKDAVLQTPDLPSTPSDAFRGVLGKWDYIAGYDVFLGAVDHNTGDIWAYKPNDWQPSIPGSEGYTAVASADDAPTAPAEPIG